MLVFAQAKINIGLKVLNKRADGYNDLDSLFYPIPLHDIIEFNKSDVFEMQITGLAVDGNHHNNLIYKAYAIMRERHNIAGLKVHLHKIIPMGAGLGGGSSDAAETLKAINTIYQLDLSDSQLAEYAQELGADCPFFIYNKPVRAQGIGTNFTNINLDLTSYYLVLVKPDIHISTAEAYSEVVLAGAEASLNLEIINQPTLWKEYYTNSFENYLFKSHSLLQEIKESFYNQGAIYASMSGSGSTIFGVFTNKPKILDCWKKFFVWETQL